MRRLQPSEVLPSWEEREAIRRASSAQQNASGVGGVLGSLVGGALGLLGAPATGGASVPISIGLGNQLGSAIGGFVGGQEADEAAAKAERLALARQEKIARDEARRRAFIALMNRSAE